MSRHVSQVYDALSTEEARFCAHFARSKCPRSAAIAAGYPRNSASRVADLLCQSLDIQSEVIRLCSSRDCSAFVARYNAINTEAYAEHVASLPADTRLVLMVEARRDRIAATKLPPAGELVIERAPAVRGAAS